jgi:hypothetical protein
VTRTRKHWTSIHTGPFLTFSHRHTFHSYHRIIYPALFEVPFTSPPIPLTRAHRTLHSSQYLLACVDAGGFNNIRLQFETIVVIAVITGRTFVMPPARRWYLLGPKELNYNDFFGARCQPCFSNVVHMCAMTSLGLCWAASPQHNCHKLW